MNKKFSLVENIEASQDRELLEKIFLKGVELREIILANSLEFIGEKCNYGDNPTTVGTRFYQFLKGYIESLTKVKILSDPMCSFCINYMGLEYRFRREETVKKKLPLKARRKVGIRKETYDLFPETLPIKESLDEINEVFIYLIFGGLNMGNFTELALVAYDLDRNIIDKVDFSYLLKDNTLGHTLSIVDDLFDDKLHQPSQYEMPSAKDKLAFRTTEDEKKEDDDKV